MKHSCSPSSRAMTLFTGHARILNTWCRENIWQQHLITLTREPRRLQAPWERSKRTKLFETRWTNNGFHGAAKVLVATCSLDGCHAKLEMKYSFLCRVQVINWGFWAGWWRLNFMTLYGEQLWEKLFTFFCRGGGGLMIYFFIISVFL